MGDANKVVLKIVNYLTQYEINADRKMQIIIDLFQVLHTDNWRREPVVAHVEPFSDIEITTAAETNKNGKSPVLDGISPQAVKIAVNCVRNLIKGSLNMLWRPLSGCLTHLSREAGSIGTSCRKGRSTVHAVEMVIRR